MRVVRSSVDAACCKNGADKHLSTHETEALDSLRVALLQYFQIWDWRGVEECAKQLPQRRFL